MFNFAVLLIAIGAVLGLYMAVGHFRGRTPPNAFVAIIHSVLAVSGAVLVLIGFREIGGPPVLRWSLGLFGVAALGGLFLVSQHMRQIRLANGVIVVHALVAVTAFLILLAALYLAA